MSNRLEKNTVGADDAALAQSKREKRQAAKKQK